jgi:hypothetical protein
VHYNLVWVMITRGNRLRHIDTSDLLFVNERIEIVV